MSQLFPDRVITDTECVDAVESVGSVVLATLLAGT
jgi:hypothetical protein